MYLILDIKEMAICVTQTIKEESLRRTKASSNEKSVGESITRLNPTALNAAFTSLSDGLYGIVPSQGRPCSCGALLRHGPLQDDLLYPG